MNFQYKHHPNQANALASGHVGVERADLKEVVVIGAGMVGLSIAMYLIKQGRHVTLIDRKGICQETSQQNAGALAFSDILPLASPHILRKAPKWLFDPLGPLSIRPSYALKIAPWLLKFGAASRPSAYQSSVTAQTQLMQLAAKEFHIMMTWAGLSNLIRQDGSLQVYEGEAQFNASQAGWAVRTAAGIQFEHVSGKRLAQLQPNLAPSITAATFVPHWETVSDPYEVGCALGEYLIEAGCVMLRDAVVSIAPNIDGATVMLHSGQPIRAKQVVVATGAWSKSLAAQLGDAVSLETERGYNTTLPLGSFDLKRQIIFGAHGFVVTPLRGGLRVGGATELGGLHLPPNFKRSDNMLNKAAKLLTGLKTQGGTQWMGFRPSMPDSLPVIAHSKASNNVVYAFGHGHLGLTQSAATGKLVSQLLMKTEPSLDLHPFRVR
jgi:D-amino-acid dehydrogenase